MEKTWIVVAESTRARIFFAKNRVQPLEELHSFSFPEARLRDQDIVTDRPGRTHESANDSRSAMEAPDIRGQQQHEFAQEICNYLEQARNKQKFGALVLVAPPTFLGALREEMNDQLGKLVNKTIKKNLATEEPSKIHGYVFD